MKINKTQLIIIIIAFVVFQCIFWMIPFDKDSATVIVSFIFLSVSIIAQVPIFMFSFKKGTPLKSKIYRFPVFKVGIVYALVSIIMNTILIILGASLGDKLPWQLATILNIVLLAAALAGILITNTYANIVEGIEKKTEAKTKEVKILRIDTNGLAALTTNASLKKDLERLAEAVKYSDPVSHEKIETLENDIKTNVEELKKMLQNNDEGCKEKISTILSLLEERNAKCKLYKE